MATPDSFPHNPLKKKASEKDGKLEAKCTRTTAMMKALHGKGGTKDKEGDMRNTTFRALSRSI